MGYQDSVNGTAVTEAFLDEGSKQQVLNYATAAARNADAALSAACREGIISYQADENTFKVQRDATLANISTLGPIHGAWLATGALAIVQSGTVTATLVRSSYTRFGRMIQADGIYSITGSGTASNLVTINLPVNVASTNANTILGMGHIFNSSVPIYHHGYWVPASATTAKLQIITISSGAASYAGLALFTEGLASGDAIAFQWNYEAAADA